MSQFESTPKKKRRCDDEEAGSSRQTNLTESLNSPKSSTSTSPQSIGKLDVLDDTHKLTKTFSPNSPARRIQHLLTSDDVEPKRTCSFTSSSRSIAKCSRRSVRKTERIVLEEKQKNLEQLLRDGADNGLQVQNFEEKGRGVVALKAFNRGEFVVEYSGELLNHAEAKVRETKYAEDENTGCYMYYFKHLNRQYCIDATAETGRLGRLVNHSRNGNLVTRIVTVDDSPRLALIAKDNIAAGDEILYDYGDRSKESLKNHPWLAS